MRTTFLFIIASAFAFNIHAQTAKEIGLQSINENAAKSVIYFLAHDELKGREAGTEMGAVAREYLISQLINLGIQPLNVSYIQNFTAYKPQGSRRFAITNNFDTVGNYTNKLNLKNILGIIEGSNTNEYVIVGAHYDHLGIGKAIDNDSIYNGADDNASGVSAVLQIARAFVLSGEKPKRNIIFAFWDGEEKGALGSRFFVDNFKNLDQIKTYLNFDMLGRNNDENKPKHVVYFYTEAYPQFGNNTKESIKTYKIDLEPEYKAWDKPITGSDQVPFALKDIPILWYHTDGHPDYHKPSDHFDKINWDKLIAITKVAFLNMWYLVTHF